MNNNSNRLQFNVSFLNQMIPTVRSTVRPTVRSAVRPTVRPTVSSSEKINSIIPLNLFQTWSTLELPVKMRENVELLKKQNPEFTHYLYDDAMCRKFIEDNFHEDVVYAFDKLKPGAFKADLWRYCVLYIKGGIYLDIKFHCINGFKLLTLTDKEYWVKDLPYHGNNGIYQAFMVCLPRNNILKNCIDNIVNYCKYSIYNSDLLNTALDWTGPGLVANNFKINTITKLLLKWNGTNIFMNNKPIIDIYKEYRSEQAQSTRHYSILVNMREVYNYPLLQAKQTIDFTNKITKIINNKQIEMFSSTPTIVEYDKDSYLVNLRWINYDYYDEGIRKTIPKQWISMNSRFILDKNFVIKSNETFLREKFENEKNIIEIGLEDIRIFKFFNKYYYIATQFCNSRRQVNVSSSEYKMNNLNLYSLNRNIILPNNYDTDKINIPEKNWSFFEYNNDLCVVYKWFPLQIGKINYNTNKMNIIEIKYNVPDCFIDMRGTSTGYIINNEIWFVLHKGITNTNYKKTINNNNSKIYYNYQHCFAVFDLNMNLLRFSEMFKLGNCKIEFCIGLIIKEEEMILSYSLQDTQSKVSVYTMETINNSIRWYDNELL